MLTYMDYAQQLLAFVLWLVLVALQIGDVATTNQFLKQRKSSEGNPIMRAVQRWFAAVQGMPRSERGYRSMWWLVKLIVLPIGWLIYYAHNLSVANPQHLLEWRLTFAVLILALFYLDVWYYGVVRSNDEVNKNKPANSV